MTYTKNFLRGLIALFVLTLFVARQKTLAGMLNFD